MPCAINHESHYRLLYVVLQSQYTYLIPCIGVSHCDIISVTKHACFWHLIQYTIPPLTNCGRLWGTNWERSEVQWSCNWYQLALHPLGSMPADALCPVSVCSFKRSYLMSSSSRWLLATSLAERGFSPCSTDWLKYPRVMSSKVRSTWLISSQSYGGNRERLFSV